MKWALLFVLLMASYSFAFTVNVPDDTVFVSTGSSKQIDIPVYSNVAESVSITVLDTKPWLTQSDTMLSLEPGVGKVLSLYASPFIDTAAGVYRFTIVLTSAKTGEEQKKFLYVSVSRLDSVEVDKLTLGGNFTPTGNVNINAIIKNYKDATVQNLVVVTTISSPTAKLVEFEQLIESLEDGEIQNITYNFALPRYAEAGVYTVTTRATAESETREKVRTFSVVRTSNFLKETSRQPGFFGFRKIVTITNIGNEIDDYVLTERLSQVDAAFYSGEEPISRLNNDFTWLVKKVRAGEARVFVYSVDFSPAVLFGAVVIIAGWVFFFRLRTLSIKKFILEGKFIELGEEFTVGVEVRNMSGSKIESATIKDFVPSVFDIKDMEGPKPVRKKLAAGTELTWHVKDLHKNEERILTYKMIPMFGIHGTIRLPRASIKYHTGKKETEKRSFYASIGIDMDSYKDKKAAK